MTDLLAHLAAPTQDNHIIRHLADDGFCTSKYTYKVLFCSLWIACDTGVDTKLGILLQGGEMTKHDLWLLQRFLSTISFLESGTLPTRVGPGPGTHSRMPTGICLIAILVELGPREGKRGVHPV